MSRSLSLVLPVRNAEETLAENLQHLFEVLTDLTERFEVVLVDEGSTDQTVEVAKDLAVQYPQVRLSRRDALSYREDSVDDALDETTGDVVIVHVNHTTLRPSVLRTLWAMDEGRAPTGVASSRSRGGLPGLPSHRRRMHTALPWTEIGGVRMIRRRQDG